MFQTKLVPYSVVVSAARDTAEKLGVAHGARPIAFTLDCKGGHTARIGHTPGSDCMAISLPSLPPDTMMSRTEATRIVALLAHELSHARMTDFGAPRAPGAMQKMVENGLEDVRIERDAARDLGWHGADSLFSDAAAANWAEAIGRGWDGSQSPTLGVTIAYLGRALTNPHSDPATAQDAARVLASLPSVQGANVRAAVDVALAGLPGVTSTAEAIALAAAVQEAHDNAAPQDQGEPQDQGDQGEPQDQGDQGEPQDQGDQGEPQGQGEGEGQGEKGEPQDQGEPGEPGKPKGSTAEIGDETANMVHDILSRMGQDAPVTGDQLNAAGDLHDIKPSVLQHGKLTAIAPAARRKQARALAEMFGAASRAPGLATIKQHVANLLRSVARTRQERHRIDGRLDRRALSRVAMGAHDVMSRRINTPGWNTAVYVLLDGSASMNELTADVVKTCQGKEALYRFSVCYAMGAAILKVAENAGAESACGIFKSPSKRDASGNHVADDGQIYVVKDWQDRAGKALPLLETTTGRGGTALTAGILGATASLKTRRADRHVLIVLTDGDCPTGADTVAGAVRMSERQGVAVVPIVFGNDVDQKSALTMFPHGFVRTHGLGDLTAATLGSVLERIDPTRVRDHDAAKRATAYAARQGG